MNKSIPEGQQRVSANVIEGPSEFEMLLVNQGFVPFHNLWGINSCFLRGAFDLDIETMEAGECGVVPVDHLNEPFIRSFVDRIEALGFPPGKITIDAGWYRQPEGGLSKLDGLWQIDPAKFPDLPGLCDWLRSRGFVPGLWFGFPYVSKGSPLLKERPDLFDLKTSPELQWEDSALSKSVWLRPSPALTGIVHCAHEAIVSLDPSIEIEGHHPDIFYSRWVDAVRVYDVILHNGWDWQGLTLAHLRGTELCCSDGLVNLDHGGGNIYLYGNPQLRVMPSEEDYIRHLRMFDRYDNVSRFPVLSLLPDHYGPAARQAVGEYLQSHGQSLTSLSDASICATKRNV